MKASGVGIQTRDELRRTLGVVWRVFLRPFFQIPMGVLCLFNSPNGEFFLIYGGFYEEENKSKSD